MEKLQNDSCTDGHKATTLHIFQRIEVETVRYGDLLGSVRAALALSVSVESDLMGSSEDQDDTECVSLFLCGSIQ